MPSNGLRPSRGVRRWLAARFPRLFLRFGRPSTDELGRVGEELAARHLARLGWRILARRLPTPAGEADIAALAGERLVVVEVKTGRLRNPDELRWRPGLRLDARRRRRLEAVARGLARSAGARSWGVELVEVVADRAGSRIVVRGPLEPGAHSGSGGRPAPGVAFPGNGRGAPGGKTRPGLGPPWR